MDKSICPICGSDTCKKQEVPGSDLMITCSQKFEFFVQNDIDNLGDPLRDKLYNLILEQLIFKPTCRKTNWRFYYEPENLINDTENPYNVNLASALQSYPDNFMEQANRALLNLSVLHPRYGDHISSFNTIDAHAAYCVSEEARTDASGLYVLMVELGYLKYVEDEISTFYISADGWKKAEQLRKSHQERKQGFVAMAFGEKTEKIRETIKKAIRESGFVDRFIDEKEHNNQIVPEIFYEMQYSKFVVVDVTYPNYGAYYEAGYAQGLGKEVIVCCKREAFEDKAGQYEHPHFDIAQKSMILWDDEADLIQRLKRRIEYTAI